MKIHVIAKLVYLYNHPVENVTTRKMLLFGRWQDDTWLTFPYVLTCSSHFIHFSFGAWNRFVYGSYRIGSEQFRHASVKTRQKRPLFTLVAGGEWPCHCSSFQGGFQGIDISRKYRCIFPYRPMDVLIPAGLSTGSVARSRLEHEIFEIIANRWSARSVNKVWNVGS